MNTEMNKALAREWFDFVGAGFVDEICDMTAPEWTMTGGLPGMPPGPAGVRMLFDSFGRIEQEWTIEDMIAEGNKVVVRAINKCRQENFLGIPSYGKEQVFSATFIFEFNNGKVVKTWRNADDLGRIIQLGASIVSVHN